MQLFQNGNDAAFEELVDIWYDRALRYVFSFLQDRHLSEDAVQDCFAALIVRKDQYNASLAFEPYFKALLRHKCLDILKKKRRSPLFLPLEEAALMDTSPQSAAVNKIYRDALMGAILAMPEEAREMLISYALEGKSYKEIANTLHLTPSLVKIRLHRLRKTLKRFKEEWE